MFWPFRHFIIEGKKLAPFLVTRYIKNQIYQNMLLIKFALLSYLQQKKIKGIGMIFDIEK